MSVKLIHGDCLEVMQTLPGNSVQMVFADLPYGGKHRKSTDCEWDSALPHDKIFSLANFLCTGASIFTAVQPFASLLVAANIKHFRYDLIWRKSNIGGWFNANRAPLRAHEHVLVFCEKAPPYYPQKTKGIPYRATHHAHAEAFKSRNLRGGTKRLDTLNITGDRFPLSVQSFHRCPSKSVHPTQKPIALLEWLIKTYTNPGDTVLDPVAGSGTTAIAALRTGRNAICIEKDKSYYDIMCKRVAGEQARLKGVA